MGRKRDSFADRLWDGIDDAFDSISPERLIDGLASSLSSRERIEEDYRAYEWGDSSSGGEDTKYWWVGCLVLLGILTFPFSLYFIVGLCAVVSYGLGIGIEILGNFADQLFALFSGL